MENSKDGVDKKRYPFMVFTSAPVKFLFLCVARGDILYCKIKDFIFFVPLW